MRTTNSWRMVVVGAVMVGTFAAAAPAGAQTTQAPEVLSVPAVVLVNRSGDTARIVGVYRCFGGDPIHLWVSAKQGGPDPSAEGAGSTPASEGGATAWYDTNITPAPAVRCDGRYHSVTVTIGRHPDKDQLTSGTAWIQFCLVAPDPSDPEGGIVASQQKFARVIRF